MKIIVAVDELPICASRRDPDSTVRRYISGPLKQVPQVRKASKIQIEFCEDDGGELRLFAKPHFMMLDMLDDRDMCFVGAPGLYSPMELSGEEHERIARSMASYGCHAVFMERTEYSRAVEEILKKNTYEFVQKNLSHMQLFEEYEEYNRRYCEKIMEIYEDGDVVWIMDHNLLLLPQMLSGISVGMSFMLPFCPLFRCIPFWDRLFLSILHCRYVEFCSESSKRSFDLLVSQKTEFRVCDTPYKGLDFPATGFSKRCIDKDAVNKVLGSGECRVKKAKDRTKIIVPFDSHVHLLGVEGYLSKYGGDIEIVFLSSRISNAERQAEISRLREYLEMNYKIRTRPFAAFNDCEFYSELRDCDICHCPEISDICKFLGIPVIGANPCDFTEVASEMDRRVRNVDEPCVGVSARSCCDADEGTSPSKMEWKKHFMTHLLAASGVEGDIDSEVRETRIRNILTMDPGSKSKEITGICVRRRLPERQREEGPVEIDVDNEKDENMSRIVEDFKKNSARTLVLDYDGTLTEIVAHPELAAPTQEIKDLLVGLSKICRVVISTGRSIRDSDAFFPQEIEVFGEHSACHRVGGRWTERTSFELKDLAWKIAEFFRQRTPGSEIESKRTGFTFHYRNSSPLIGKKQARALFELLKKMCSDNVKEGNHILEVRSSDKSSAMEAVQEGFVLCAGDDVADEDMMRICTGHTVKVGSCEKTVAKYTVESPGKFRKLLKRLLE